MARKCAISGKTRTTGNRVSHAKNRTRHVFRPNLQIKKFLMADPAEPGKTKTVRLNVSTRMLRTIDKLGIEAALRTYNVRIEDITR